MAHVTVYRYGDNQPALKEPVFRIMFIQHRPCLTASSLEEFNPLQRLEGKPPYPEPLIGWFQGKFPRPDDLWMAATPELVALLDATERDYQKFGF